MTQTPTRQGPQRFQLNILIPNNGTVETVSRDCHKTPPAIVVQQEEESRSSCRHAVHRSLHMIES
jgi:hypothetical protein